MAGRRWIWIEGNHDPGPIGIGGTHRLHLVEAPLTFRHIADRAATGEVSGHYHPKARLASRGKSFSRPCFLFDRHRAVLPAYGTYTGGLFWTAPALQGLMTPPACALLLGSRIHAVPMPRDAGPRPERPPRAPAPYGMPR